MKFQLSVFIFYLVTGSLNGQSLTPEENNKRLDNCGEFAGQHYSTIFSWAQNKIPTEYVKTAAMISSRHFLVSSRLVLHGKKWAYNQQKQTVDMKNCTNKEHGYIHVPQEALTTMSFGWPQNFTRAIIICSKDTFTYVNENWMSFLMIVEISPEVSKEYDDYVMFCLPSENYKLRMNEDHAFWQYIEKGIVNNTLKILSEKHDGFFYADKYDNNNDGILVDKVHKTLVGLGVNSAKGRFHKLQLYVKDFCDLFGICKDHAGKLSVKEDEKRLKSCGTGTSSDIFGYVTDGKAFPMMTLISSRHVLTSADIVLDRNSTILKASDCEPNITSVQVPLEAFSGLWFSWKQKPKVENAFIICDFQLFQTHSYHGLPMIIEVSPNFSGDKPCLPDRATRLKPNDPLRLFQLSGKNYSSTDLTFESYYDEDRNIEVKGYGETSSQSGNPLFKIVELGRANWTIVGVSTKEHRIFFSVQWILQKICELTGICRSPPPTVPPTAEAPTTVPTVLSTTESPTTTAASTQESTTIKAHESTPESENTTTLSIIEPVTPKESTPPEPSMGSIKSIDLDKEYEEFKEREAKEDGDWDEWGNDFYVSADFFTKSGRKSELFVGFLMVIVVVLG